MVEDDVALTRELYRAWNDTPLEWEGRRVEEHFVHLPKAGSRVSGLWAEVAVDGVVLFERGLELSRALAGIRREIAAGRIVRRSAHGQPSGFYSEADVSRARDGARLTVGLVKPHVLGGE